MEVPKVDKGELLFLERAACMPNLGYTRRAGMRLVYLGEEIVLCYQTIRTEVLDDLHVLTESLNVRN